MGRVHIFAGIRKPDPDALHIVAACQLDPDAVVAPVGKHRRVAILREIKRRGKSDKISIAESIPVFLAIRRSYLCRVKKFPSLGGRVEDMLHDEVTQGKVVPGSIEQFVVLQLIGNLHYIAGCLRLLDLHGPAKQQSLFCSHVFKPVRQPLIL